MEKSLKGLKRGGLLLIKDNARRPSWKYLLLCAEEKIVNGARVLAGQTVWKTIYRSRLFVRHPEEVEKDLVEFGLKIKRFPLDRGSYLPHVLWLAYKQ